MKFYILYALTSSSALSNPPNPSSQIQSTDTACIPPNATPGGVDLNPDVIYPTLRGFSTNGWANGMQPFTPITTTATTLYQLGTGDYFGSFCSNQNYTLTITAQVQLGFKAGSANGTSVNPCGDQGTGGNPGCGGGRCGEGFFSYNPNNGTGNWTNDSNITGNDNSVQTVTVFSGTYNSSNNLLPLIHFNNTTGSDCYYMQAIMINIK